MVSGRSLAFARNMGFSTKGYFRRSPRVRSYRRQYKKGFYKAKRRFAKASGSYGKVGVFMSHLRAKVFVSKRKYKVMAQYAALIAKLVIGEHHKNAADQQMGHDAGIRLSKTHHTIPKRSYRRLIGVIMERMVITNWYTNWYEHRNYGLARDAKGVLETHTHQHTFAATSDETKKILEGVAGGIGFAGVAALGLALI